MRQQIKKRKEADIEAGVDPDLQNYDQSEANNSYERIDQDKNR